MNKIVPNAKNWPDEKPRKKRSKLRVLDERPNGTITAELTRLLRDIQQEKFGKVRAFGMVTISGRGNDRMFFHHFGGDYRRDEMFVATHRLRHYVEIGGGKE